MSSGIIIWNKICGSEGTEFKIWENGDFNNCFEKFVFSMLPHALLLTITSYHFARHQHLRRRGLITRYTTLHARLIICLFIILSAVFLFSIEYAYDRSIPPLVYILWGLVYTLSWFVHSCYVWRLHRLDNLSLRGHWLVVLATFIVFVTQLVLLRTAIVKRIYSTGVFHDFEEIFIYVTTIFYAFYFLTFFYGRRTGMVSGLASSPSVERLVVSLRNQTVRSLQKCPEDTSWFLPKLFFCWTGSLMRKGYRGEIYSVEDLYDLPEDLQTSSVLQCFYLTKQKFTRMPSPPCVSPHLILPSQTSNVDVNSSRTSINQPCNSRVSSVKREDSTHASCCGHVGEEKKPEQKSLLCLLLAAFGWEYFPLGLLKLFSDVCSFCNPILLNLLILYISSPNEKNMESSLIGYLYSAGLFTTTFLGSLASTQFDYRTSRVSLKFRAVIIDSIYKKTLSVSQVDLKSEFSTGEIVNLMSTDTDRVVGFCPSFHQFWSLPIQVIVVLYLLYLQVGLAFLSGVGFAILLIPINRWIAIKIKQLSEAMMSQKDARVKLINETIQGIRTMKFHAWEEVFIRKIEAIRSSELLSLKKRKYLDALCVFFWAATPIAISTLTFTTYVLLGNSLTAAKVFTSISLFAILITPLNAFPWVINGLMEAWVSLNRMQRLLNLHDLNPNRHYDFFMYYLGFLPSMPGEIMLKMKDASFTWHRDVLEQEIESFPSQTLNHDLRNIGDKNDDDDDDDDDDDVMITMDTDDNPAKPVKVNLYRLNLEVKQGMLVGVVGSVGSGKSSLLSAILGEMRRVQSLNPSRLSLSFPLDGGFGYFSQEPWIQRGSLRGNILFGKKFHQQKFTRVVEACALDTDIAMLPKGDYTEIGESGVTLSGGQKARVALARTAYQNKKFYLLDDPYASVDAHVASRIHTGCIMDLLGQTTRIVVTHHIRFLKDANLIIIMEKGRIVRCGSPSHINLETFTQHSATTTNDNDANDDDDELILNQIDDDKNPEQDTMHCSNVCLSDDDDDDDDDDELLNDDQAHVLPSNEPDRSRLYREGNDDESKQTGMVKLKVYTIYWRAVGCCLAVCVLLSLFFMQASRNICDWWLSYWVTHAMNQSQSTVNVNNQSQSTVNANNQYIPSSNIHSNQSSIDRIFLPYLDGNRIITSNLMNEFYRLSAVVGSTTKPSINYNNHSYFDYIINNNNNHDVSFYLIIYASMAGFNALATIVRAILFAYGGIEAAKIMHSKLLDSIFKASIKFFDMTSLGRIINRFSSDVFSIDDSLPFILNIFLAQSFGLLGAVIICCYGLPFSMIVIFVLAILYYFIQRYYRHTSRELKRISCITLSPIYAHFSETLAGLTVIRAHRVTSRFEREALAHLDLNQRSQFASCAIIQWLNVRFQMIGVALVTCVSFIAILQKDFGTVSPGLVGLAISYVLSITSLLGGLVLSFTETEKMMIAVERVDDYINNIPHEDDFTNPPEHIPLFWPFVGVITFNNVTLRYGEHLPDVLKGVTFVTRQGERVGVVGRTGSGKSSLFLALMRMVPIRKGKIYIDGVDVHSLPLRNFRSKISIIPQDPFLFSGTIRENLDPSKKHKDSEIRMSLSKCNMLEVVDLIGGLNAMVEERGQQFSAGQRQLLCLARTMLSKSHVLCIDEAMANVDMATDKMLQATIRKHFRGKTVITIAHRIETILDYDMILVMEQGELVEFGTPHNLQSDQDSVFCKLLATKNQ